MSSEDSERGVADFGLCVPRAVRSCRVDDRLEEVVEAGAAGGAPLVLRLAGGEGGDMVEVRLDQKSSNLAL